MPPITEENKRKIAFDKVAEAVKEFNTMEKFDFTHWANTLPTVAIGDSIFVRVGSRIIEPNQIKSLTLREDKPESFITCILKDDASFVVSKGDCYTAA